MSFIKGLGGIGTGSGSGAPAPAPTPIAVASLVVTSATASTILVSFAAPSTGTVAWNYRAHGATVWLPAPGGSSFGAGTGTIAGLAAATAYDLQAVATNNGDTATTELDGVSTAAAASPPVQPSTPTRVGNRYDLVLDQSAVAPGATVTGSVLTNGLWPPATGRTVTLSNGTVINLPTSGSAPVAFSFVAGAAGEVSIASTNTAGLYDPYPAPLTVFAPGSGAAQTIAATLVRADMATHQRDNANGNPSGFSASWARGWGEVWFTLGQAAPALFGRLYDAHSSGASGTVGSGTALTGIVQLHGAVAAGTVRVLLPAGPYDLYVDLATDAAFTTPVRVPQRVRVGVVIGKIGRSQESGLGRGYAYGAGATPLPTTFTETATWMAFDSRYAITDCGWYLHDAAVVDPYQYHYSEPASSGAQEIGRLMQSQLGVRVAVTGLAGTAGNLGLDSFLNPDGSFNPAFNDTVNASCGGKFRYLWGASGGWDGVNSTYPTETAAELQRRFVAMVAKLAVDRPACAVIGWVTGASGVFGNDGSRAVGYTRNQTIWMGLEASNRMCVSKESYNWNEFNSGHATMSARVEYVRSGFRKLMAAELAAMGGLQTDARGPTLAGTGTHVAGARTITIGYTLPAGASALQTVGLTHSNPNPVTVNGATAQEIAGLFAVYAAGGSAGNGTAIKIDSATIDAGAQTITLALTGASGVTYADGTTGALPGGFSVQFAADFGVSNGALSFGTGRSAVLADDRIDTANGIPYGWHMLPALDIAVPA